MAADDFLHDKALSCRHNVSDAYSKYNILKCEQPVSGRFLTIMNHKYVETDIRREDFWLGCLSLCGLNIHVTSKSTRSWSYRFKWYFMATCYRLCSLCCCNNFQSRVSFLNTRYYRNTSKEWKALWYTTDKQRSDNYQSYSGNRNRLIRLSF